MTEPRGVSSIETVTDANFEKVLPLIGEYQKFYGSQPNEDRNRKHFGQYLDKHDAGVLFLARGPSAEAIGFATLYFIPASVNAGTSCLLNDLFCVSRCRGQGVGLSLMRHCAAFAKERGFHAMEWHTQQGNTVAQKLYDGLHAHKSAWHVYSWDLE